MNLENDKNLRSLAGAIMTHTTKAIVLRTTRYGETSLIVTVLTELFGIQSYLLNGVRSTKKSAAKANLFQPSSILELVVYHNEQKDLQRIKEFRWLHLYQHILSDVVKNCVALYMVELMNKCLKQPEAHEALYDFCEDALIQLDTAGKTVTANFTLYFALHFTHFFGFRMHDNYDEHNIFLDLQEGNFTNVQPDHPHFIEGEMAAITSQLLKVMQPEELASFKLNHTARRKLLLAYQDYYALHIHDFGQMKTLRVLSDVLT
ncbi:MAG: DNA repair protein RecO [Ferruginibacter sp.]